MTQSLTRSIGLGGGVAFYVGAIVGAGVLILPGITASIAGPAAILGWFLVSIAMLPVALTFAALAARYPDAGGVATFSRRAFGEGWGSTVGWFYLVASIVGQAIMALTGAHYLGEALGLDSAVRTGVAVAMLLGSTSLNLRGLVASGRLQMALSAAVVAIVVLAIAVAAPRVRAEHWTPFAPHGIAAVGQVAVLAYVAFFGWEAVTQLSAEFRDPARDILRATLVSAALITVLYLGIVAATIGTGTYGDVSTGRVALARIVASVLGPVGGRIVGVGGFLITAGTLNTYVAASSRLAYALARDRDLPAPLARLSGGVPRRAAVAVAVGSGLVLVSTVVASLDVETLLVVPSVLGLAVNVVAMAAGTVLLGGWRRIVAFGGLVPCALLLPFAYAGAAIPVAVAASAWAWRRVRRRPRASQLRVAALQVCCPDRVARAGCC